MNHFALILSLFTLTMCTPTASATPALPVPMSKAQVSVEGTPASNQLGEVKRVYVTDNRLAADYRVYVSDSLSIWDVKVIKTSPLFADLTVFIVDTLADSDMSVYFVDSPLD